MSEQIAQISEPVIAICINRTYKDGLSTQQLYDHTRGTWKVSVPRAEKAHYAVAVCGGVIQEVYEIYEWLPSDSDEFVRLLGRPKGNDGRSGFVGGVAPDDIRDKYVGKRLPDRFYGFPIRYYNC
ncbi:MAG: hypothetical protein LC754_08955 [Acidobacteria bacterium]|nr:hypothetical protein [Acidobacteriota bacterium]